MAPDRTGHMMSSANRCTIEIPSAKPVLFVSKAIIPGIAESLKKFYLFYYFEPWYNDSISPTHPNWKNIVRDNILHFEKSAWHSHCGTHPEMQIASSCLANVTPFHLWSLADHFPDLVDCMFKLD